jgi:hypothetical protein
MAHDLQFNVHNGDGNFAEGPHDQPIPGGIMPSKQNKMGTVELLSSQLSQSSHPVVIIFRILFKALALLVYITGGWFTKGFHPQWMP